MVRLMSGMKTGTSTSRSVCSLNPGSQSFLRSKASYSQADVYIMPMVSFLIILFLIMTAENVFDVK